MNESLQESLTGAQETFFNIFFFISLFPEISTEIIPVISARIPLGKPNIIAR